MIQVIAVDLIQGSARITTAKPCGSFDSYLEISGWEDNLYMLPSGAPDLIPLYLRNHMKQVAAIPEPL